MLTYNVREENKAVVAFFRSAGLREKTREATKFFAFTDNYLNFSMK